MESCRTCKFYVPLDSASAGEHGSCRVRAPQVVAWHSPSQADGGAHSSYWPQVWDIQWCGEWQEAQTTLLRRTDAERERAG